MKLFVMTKPNAGDKPLNVYDLRLNGNTHNFGGLEWIVDGEIGRMNYPGTWAECRRHRIAGIEKKDGWNKGRFYYLEKSIFGKKLYRRHLTEAEYRLDRSSRKEKIANG